MATPSRAGTDPTAAAAGAVRPVATSLAAADGSAAATGAVAAPATVAAAAQSTSPAQSAAGVRLAQAAEAVSTAITLGVRDGVSQARIQLSPDSLGGLQIHLQSTPGGIVARVIADHSQAASTLAQNSDDLRRSLQDSGVTLLRLDIGSSDRQGAPAQERPAPGTGGNGAAAEADEQESAAAAISTGIPIQGLSGSALVNVLA
jgi:flagellar hook-length control protein FliK